MASFIAHQAGGKLPNKAFADVDIHRDGTIQLRIGIVDIGAGQKTIFAMIAAEQLGVRVEDIQVVYGDTEGTRYGPASHSSRVTAEMGPPVLQAAAEARQKLFALAAPLLGAKPEELDLYIRQMEEAEKRDHRKLGREMDLFHFQEEGPGTVFWHAGGWTVFQEIVAYMRRRLRGDYDEVNAPELLDKSLWETSGHWQWFRENMFQATSAGDDTEDERVYAIKPMNCPGHIQIFKHGLRSYRELPLRMAEFGKVHRYEPSGALHGLLRVRAFTQDDAHVFCTEEQIADECMKINDLILSTYADFGFEGEITVKLSTRPEKRVGSDAAWDHAEAIMHDVLRRIEAQGQGRIKTSINPGEGAFYGPKFEYVLKDAIGRDWQCGTTQVDFNLPERFDAFYIAADGSKKTPVMIHRAICGSMERFLGVVLEHYAGHLPLWLSPKQAVVATITSDADDYAAEVTAAARKLGLRADADLRNEKINYKVREHSLAKVPVLLVVGKKEASERKVSIRRLGKEGQQVVGLDEALAALVDEATPPDLKRAKTR